MINNNRNNSNTMNNIECSNGNDKGNHYFDFINNNNRNKKATEIMTNIQAMFPAAMTKTTTLMRLTAMTETNRQQQTQQQQHNHSPFTAPLDINALLLRIFASLPL